MLDEKYSKPKDHKNPLRKIYIIKPPYAFRLPVYYESFPKWLTMTGRELGIEQITVQQEKSTYLAQTLL
jgi:hypothetical protein